jgi:hypothetical protein
LRRRPDVRRPEAPQRQERRPQPAQVAALGGRSGCGEVGGS